MILFQVVAPTAIFKGDKDDMVDIQDVNKLVGLRPNVVFDHLVEKVCTQVRNIISNVAQNF